VTDPSVLEDSDQRTPEAVCTDPEDCFHER
jgi:hypothetical protein